MVTRAKTTKTDTAANVADVTKQFETTVQAAQQAAAKNVEQTMAYTKEQVDKMGKQVFQAYGDVAAYNKENVEAVVQSGTVFAKGLETLSKAVMAYTQAQYEQGVTVAKAMMGVKTMRELVDLQSEYARTSFDAMVAEATKVSEISVKVANEAIEPLSARVNATVEKMAKPSLAA